MIATKTLSPSLGVAISLDPARNATAEYPRRALPYGADSERTLQRTAVVGDEELS
ncbi:hypothetical protein OG568_03390 [Streptomyces sp. NBC_01450]|jgi:hypothetical protein|uniref:hypothetical protein n=1 Tax=Streptomyces sp. NBC_01450 TaxID=2903871 RepID=UPI002E301030|nr:hypothetical protein [Streptomyces sp. NBC_01450]